MYSTVYWYIVRVWTCVQYSILVHCEGVDFKVTSIKFMTVVIRRRDAACF